MRKVLIPLAIVGVALSVGLLTTDSEALAEDSAPLATATVDAQDPASWPAGAANVVEAVQKAVDQYDIVHLQGTFDFENDSVSITHSVEILGDGTDSLGNHTTRIIGGGYGAITSTVDPSAQIVIRDIEFDGPEVALSITASQGVEVTGCTIKNVAAPWGGTGMRLSGAGVTGSVAIEENHFDISAAGVWSFGLYVQQIYADIVVRDNAVENFNTTGLWVNSAGSIVIADNTIVSGPPGASPYRNGILVGTWWLPSGDRGNIEVVDNTIIVGGHPAEGGIATEDSEQELRDICRVADNKISFIDDSTEGLGILLLGHSSNWTFAENVIDGGGHELLSGIALYPGIEGFSAPQEGNIFVENEVTSAGVVFGAVVIDASALASDNRFLENRFGDIDGDGIYVDGDNNQFIENRLDSIAGDGFLLIGDNNLLEENVLHDIGGQDVVDLGVGNHVTEDDSDD